MRRTPTRLHLLAAAALMAGCTDAGPTISSASDPALAGMGTPIEASANPMELAVIGDVPYGTAATALYPELIAQINDDPKVRRVVHVGDIKSGSTVCSDEWFEYIRASFTTFEDPLVYTPGDNEWTDCHRPNNGRYSPLERLDRIREVFFARPGATLGRRSMRVEAQPAFPENQLWMESRVVFAAIHGVGSNNGLAPWTGNTAATLAQEAEWAAREAANRAWLNRAFDLARERRAAGVVLFVHADMWHPDDVATGVDFSGHRRFVELLARRSADFGAPVILFAGDSHKYRVDRPLVDDTNYDIPFDVPNLTQITVEQSILGPAIAWVRLRVDPRSPEVFTWEEVR